MLSVWRIKIAGLLDSVERPILAVLIRRTHQSLIVA
jgi:hypothetical protein